MYYYRRHEGFLPAVPRVATHERGEPGRVCRATEEPGSMAGVGPGRMTGIHQGGKGVRTSLHPISASEGEIGGGNANEAAHLQTAKNVVLYYRV